MRCACARGLFSAVLLLGGLSLLVGCDSGPSTATGKVTLDGKPLANGAITFLPKDGDGPTAGASIKDGAYTLEIFPGTKQVVITGYEVVGQVPAYGDPKGPMKDVTKSIVPPKYQQNSELSAEIKEGVNENVNFELTSK